MKGGLVQSYNSTAEIYTEEDGYLFAKTLDQTKHNTDTVSLP